MAQLSRHPSLRFSVFEVAVDIGLDTGAFDGNFAPIVEEDESEPSPSPMSRGRQRQRQTHSSDELTDSSFPLTPPSSNDAVISTRPLALASDHPEDRPRFIEQFHPASPEPLFTSSKPTTPRTAPGKLRKVQTPGATTPASEGLRSGFSTDTERDPGSPLDMKSKGRKDEAKEREKFGKALENQRAKASPRIGRGERPVQTDDEEKKQLLSGLLRFRTRSKERKAAAKQAMNQSSTPPPPPEVMPMPSRTQSPPPPLPIAGKFVRKVEDINFRPNPRESGSSHGGTTSVGHGSNTSSDANDYYPRPRDRSSRYERPHPAWRTGPSTLGNVGLASLRVGNSDLPPPPEVVAYPPGQSVFDREPTKPQLQVDTSTKIPGSTEAPPAIDVDALNRYYGFASAEATPAVPSTPSPSSRAALAQALTPLQYDPRPNPRSTPVPTTPVPVSPSPYIVPSPNPSQMEFLPPAQPREKRGRTNVPPALDPSLVNPRRFMMTAGDPIPPPTPPPTTELPPIPAEFSSPSASSSRPSPMSPPQQQRTMLSPPGLRAGPPSPLGMRSSSPNLSGPNTPRLTPTYSQRPGTAPQEGAPSSSLSPRPVSPMQRGKMSPFPSRPITPTRPITPVRRPQSPPKHEVQPLQLPQRTPVTSPERSQTGGYLVNRRPEFGAADNSQVQERSYGGREDVFTRPSEDSGYSTIPAPARSRTGDTGNNKRAPFLAASGGNQYEGVARKRSQRRSNYQSGLKSLVGRWFHPLSRT
ncbi:hypothetical protein FS842_009085 [Serendipita sp. 407]|nr:hypothetical protein FS842_009085 [Serendipita sp. 407]